MTAYVAVLATRTDDEPYRRLVAKVASGLPDWRVVLQTPVATLWVRQKPISRLGHRSLEPGGYVVGFDVPFPPGSGSNTCVCPILGDRWGAYVAFGIDPAKKEVRVSRDPSGRIECWRMSLNDGDLLFSDYADVRLFQDGPLTIDWTFIDHHLRNDWNHGHATGYREIIEVLPGELLTVLPGRSFQSIWWAPDQVAADAFQTPEEAQQAIRQAAEASVEVWASRYDNILLNLSGGLDSAILLGLLRQSRGQSQIAAVNYVIDDIEGDERAYARSAAGMHGVEVIEQSISVSNAGEMPSFSLRLMRPTLRILSLGYDTVGGALMQQLETDAFVTGTGGDHLFYDHLGVDALCDYRRRGATPWGFVRTAHGLALAAKDTIWNAFGVALKDILGHHPLAAFQAAPNPYLANANPRANDHGRYTHPWSWQAEKAPPAKGQQFFRMVELRRHYLRYGRADAADEVHPFCSLPVMTAAMRTPADWFVLGGLQRGLERNVFGDLLPSDILERQTKGYNASHWLSMIERDLPAVRSLLLEGRLQARGLLDREALEADLNPVALAGNRNFHSLVTILTTEMWIQQAEEDQAVITT